MARVNNGCEKVIDSRHTSYILCIMKTQTSIKIDPKTKKEATRLAEELGLSLSSVINASLKQFVRNRELVVADSLTPTPYLEKVLREAENDLRNGKTNGPYTAEEFISHLKKL